ncbi:MAG: U32 family peptidase [Prevotella sp.]|nr:U32 family peptidase [Prevotella sp.]
MQVLELLAPARDVECGKAAIDHGADAVYIGAERFGARAAAGNSLSDIAELCSYAHGFRAKVYVTVNTIIYDNELEATRRLLHNLADIGVDAILVQDMALLDMLASLPVECHASTQTDNRTAEKVRWLKGLGFSRVVLARELSIDEIREIHESVPDVELEVFVHGALCVSYSGLCYASQYCFGRSANRGECAQFCRLSFDMVDSDGTVMEKSRHLLSLKDMKQIDNIEALAEAGATSFKIEGRLKDMVYVKNVTAAYSQRLDALVERFPDRYRRASLGRSRHLFTPNLSKTFNRGFTTYFASGRRPDISSPDTPKALGEYVGKVKEIRGPWFTVAGLSTFANGDGLCFINDERQLEGFRVNKVENNRLFPLNMPKGMRKGTSLYRNNDQEFERMLSRPSAERKIKVHLSFSADGNKLCLKAEAEADEFCGIAIEDIQLQKAEKPQHENIVRQLSKLGGTSFVADGVDIPSSFDYFVPSSLLAKMRREAIDSLAEKIRHTERPHNNVGVGDSVPHLYPSRYTYLYNIANAKSREFYLSHGLRAFDSAFEKSSPSEGIVMQCRYCLRYALGYCVKRGGRPSPYREPYFLCLPDGRRFRLQFDCAKCQMNVCYDEK